MKLDLRIHIGSLFSVYGALLALYGLSQHGVLHSEGSWLDVDVVWGAVLLVFGVALLISRRRTLRGERNV